MRCPSLRLRVAPLNLMWTASNTFLCKSIGHLSRTLIFSKMGLLFYLCLDCSWCWLIANLETCLSTDFPCSSTLSPSDLLVSPYIQFTTHIAGARHIHIACYIVQECLEDPWGSPRHIWLWSLPWHTKKCHVSWRLSIAPSVTPFMYGRTAYWLPDLSST